MPAGGVLTQSCGQTGTGVLSKRAAQSFCKHLIHPQCAPSIGEEKGAREPSEKTIATIQGITGKNFPIFPHFRLSDCYLQGHVGNNRYCCQLFDAALFLDAGLAQHLGHFPSLFIYSPNLLPPRH